MDYQPVDETESEEPEIEFFDEEFLDDNLEGENGKHTYIALEAFKFICIGIKAMCHTDVVALCLGISLSVRPFSHPRFSSFSLRPYALAGELDWIHVRNGGYALIRGHDP